VCVQSNNKVGKYNAKTGEAISENFITDTMPTAICGYNNILYVSLWQPQKIVSYNLTTGSLINATLVEIIS
ncbi:MAG: hypothetical protein EB127_29705, partial [Alphaproteobacteria bacterium]|nr:hypothetical protein [Alphaproteobacteria bacterium]